MYRDMIVAGILLSMLYYELIHISPGGIVTPAYLALCLGSPLRILYTLCLVVLVWAVLKVLSNFWILYGKREFAVSVFFVFFLDLILSETGTIPFGIETVGYVVPALILRDAKRQGAFATGVSMGIVTGLLSLGMFWFGVI